MSKRINISSGTKWEKFVGYSRAVRVGNIVTVAGTTAVNEAGELVGENDVYAQTQFIFSKIEKALKEAGATRDDVVRTRMFAVNVDEWEEIGRAHGEYFADVCPAATLVEVSRLINPELLIEIEVDAVCAEVKRKT